jgi:phytanoyl-CoA dioxygenase PhyH
MSDTLEAQLDQLERDGFILIEGALTPEETEHYRGSIEYARAQGWADGLNEVGNMWFDSLLRREPEHYGKLVGHPSVAPILKGMMGPQCELRSLRAHVNPGPYLQEWHLDFYGYWEEARRAQKYRLAQPPAGINTTFYFQDNDPGQGHLKFVKNGHQIEPPHLYPINREKFEDWCEGQEHVVIHPKAGDCVLFLSHIPHQGAKDEPTMDRSNVVCHYQLAPMHGRVWFVSQPMEFDHKFPFLPEREEVGGY